MMAEARMAMARKQGRQGLQRRRERWWPLPSGACRGAELFGVFLDNFTQDGDVDWPHCEKFVEEVNKVPEQVLKC